MNTHIDLDYLAHEHRARLRAAQHTRLVRFVTRREPAARFYHPFLRRMGARLMNAGSALHTRYSNARRATAELPVAFVPERG